MSSRFGFHQGFTPTSGGADPEQANNIEVGVRHVKDSTFVEFLYFKTDYQNMFGSCTTSECCTVICHQQMTAFVKAHVFKCQNIIGTASNGIHVC